MNFTEQILEWHQTVDRKLPWKESRNPYNIWISEIVLQQTRVAQGTKYYHRLTESFPTVAALASAHEDELMRLWKGLGYYSRARNMHKTAKIVVDAHRGQFPTSYKEILSLPGIGPYTAAAIASFAYDLPHAVVDGNVYRVLSRVYGIFTPINSTDGKKEFSQLAQNLLSKDRPADYNQAIMDFGALCCKPKKPDCHHCPMSADCSAYINNCIDQLPQKEKKLKRRSRHFIGMVLTNKKGLIIEKRIEKDIWQGLYSIPMVEHDIKSSKVKMIEMIASKYPDREISHVTQKQQKLTHQDISIDFFTINMDDQMTPDIIVSKETYDDYAYPRVIDEFIKDFLRVSQNN